MLPKGANIWRPLPSGDVPLAAVPGFRSISARTLRQSICTFVKVNSNREPLDELSVPRLGSAFEGSYGFLGSLAKGSYMKWASWINFLLGLWLIVSAFSVSHAQNPAMSQEIVLGILIAGLAVAAALASTPTTGIISWAVALCGLWTLIAPFVIGNAAQMPTSMKNDVAVGIIVCLLGLAKTLSGASNTEVIS
jgi:hypothetical protein